MSRQDGNAQSTQSVFVTTHHLAQSEVFTRTLFDLRASNTSINDAQTDLRLANAKTTLEHYIKLFPESVRVAVESLVDLLKSKPEAMEGGQDQLTPD